MAGRPNGPFQRAFLEKVEQAGGWARVFEQIADGVTITKIAGSLGVSRCFLSHQLNDDPDLRALLEGAREEGASALIEEAREVVRSTPADQDAVARARMKADVLIQLAGIFNPARYARKDRGATVEINIRDAHLSAVRKYNAVPAPEDPKALPPASGVEVEVRG